MPEASRDNRIYLVLGMLIVVLAAAGLRYGSVILTLSDVRDEALMKEPIDDIIRKGWSVETAIDYQEVKGPVFFWAYAAGQQVIAAIRGQDVTESGAIMNDLRLVSVLFFIASALPFLLILQRCGARGVALLAGAGLYVILPYNAIVGQLLMSEPSFIFFAFWLMWIVLWGLGRTEAEGRPVLGPVLFAIVLSILLHHRPHAAAFAGAAVLVAFERDGLKSWRWWVAAALAGLSRLPLWHRWGGLVTSEYQEIFAMGLRVDCQTYLFAALLPVTLVFLWPALTVAANRSRRWWMLVGGAVGLALAIFAQPDLFHRVGEVRPQAEYAGVVKTALQTALPRGMLMQIALGAMAVLGGVCLGALLVVTWATSASTFDGMTRRFAFWTMAGGMGLFSLTTSPVYDRYLLIWTLLIPIVWLRTLPRWLILAQAMVCVLMLAYLVNNWN